MQKSTNQSRHLDTEFDLCDSCLARITKKSRRDSPRKNAKSCFVCRGIMDSIDSLADMVVKRIEGYQFETFTVGSTLKPSILDRDDYIRSKIRARGADSIKAVFTKKISGVVSARTKKSLDRDDPDITIVIDTRFGSCQVISRKVILQARYTKSCRNISQKKTPCNECAGRGCAHCDFTKHAANSIESIFERYLKDRMGGTEFCFVWAGSEGITSRVQGDGRRFYVRIKNPKRRYAQLSPKTECVQFHNIRVISRMPGRMPVLRSKIRMVVRCIDGIFDDLKALHGIQRVIRVKDQANKESFKKIHSIHYRRLSGGSLQVILDVEGGLPVKRFVSGEDVWPSISSTLDKKCECWRFDFMDIRYV